MKASAQSSRSFFCMGATYTCNNFFLASKVFVHLLGKVPPSMGLTHMRSMCVGVAETGRFRDLRSATRTPRPRPRHLLRKRCTKTIVRKGKSASLSNPVFAPVRESFHGELCEINLSVIAEDESLRQFIGNSNEFALILFSR